MKILGIDPGTRITGYGLIEQRGNRLIHIDNGALFTKTEQSLAVRLQTIYEGLCRIIREHSPDVVAVEEIFVAQNARSALKLGHARGAALLAGVNHGIEVFEYSALQVKSAVVGYGKASKGQVQQMVKVLLNLPEIAQEDASDALAVAVCHAHSHHQNNLLRNGTGQFR